MPDADLPSPRRSEAWRDLLAAVQQGELSRRMGTVMALRGLTIESQGPNAKVGELCAIVPPGEPALHGSLDLVQRALAGARIPGARTHPKGPLPLLAEVVGVHPERVTLMAYGDVGDLVAGSQVIALGTRSGVGVGDALLGRVIDAFGRPLDGMPGPETSHQRPIKGRPLNPMRRPRIDTILETGIRAIDAMLTLGRGQRVGIFSGSGVGKSTLLGMIVRHAKADVNVIALIGERGREVREFIDKQLGPEGLARSVVVVATADQPALARIRAAHAALSIAEHFRDEGKQVLLTMDSITRLAMARREVGLAAGEPPTARGYTPSVFAELPELCERCGTSESGGSITALLTVLVEGDDFNEPISDALRAILDGHIILSRQLANQGQYPAIDLLRSVSRLLPDLATEAERSLVREVIKVLALMDRNHQMVELGAYERGSNPELDTVLASWDELQDWLKQTRGGVARHSAMDQLAAWHRSLSSARAPGQPAAPEGTVRPARLLRDNPLGAPPAAPGRARGSAR